MTDYIDPITVAIERAHAKPPLSKAEYAVHYNRGWKSQSGDDFAYAGRHGLSVFSHEVNAYYDGFLDQMAGREKWHMRDCTDHTGSNVDHGCRRG